MRIGILGGTFDPIHNGHIKLAEAAVDSLKLDKLILIPAFIPPHKTRSDIAPAKDRLEMVKLAIEGYPKFELSDYEIAKGKTSFSVETLTHFRKVYPTGELFFIIGSDSYLEFHTWNQPDEILKLAKIAVAKRPEYPYDKLPNAMEEIIMEPMPISSSQIRTRVRQGREIDHLVPAAVASYISRKKLYLQNQ